MLKSKLSPVFKSDKRYFRQFLASSKLYGREEETRKLIENFLLQSGQFILGHRQVTQAPESPALVEQIHKPINEKNGYFISGKFDQLHRSTPYYAVLEAFKELIQVFLTQDKEYLIKTKDLYKARWVKKVKSSQIYYLS